MTVQDTQPRQVSPSDLGLELCRYRPRPLGESLRKRVIVRWLLYLVSYAFMALALALGATYMMAPLMLFLRPVRGRLWEDPLWGPIYVACYAILVFVSFVWPRLVYLAIHERGFLYRGMRRRYSVRFADIARCFTTRGSCGVALVLRDSTHLRFHYLGGHFGRQCVGQLFNRINEHLADRPEKATQQSLHTDETAATPAKRSEMAVPNSLWCSEFVAGLLLLSTFLVAPTIFAVVSLVVFQLDLQGKICTWLLLLFTTSLLWLVSQDARMRYSPGGGIREFGRDFVSFFARKRFLESVPQCDGSVGIRYGFQLLGHRHYFFKLPVHKIQGLDWRPGQGGSRTVFIQCDDDRFDYGLTSIGPTGGVNRIDPLGLAIVDFLCRAGARLVEGEDEATYKTTSAAPRTGSRL
jgi:hypothetical protein